MNNNTVLIIFFLAVCFAGYSQMSPAKMLPPNIEEKIKIKAPAEAVWNYLLGFDNIQDFGSEIIEKSTTLGRGMNAIRTLNFINGTKRTEEMAIIAIDTKKIGVKVLTLEGVYSRKFYYFEVNEMGGYKCIVSMKAYYGLQDEVNKDETKENITSEFKILLKGLKNYFEN